MSWTEQLKGDSISWLLEKENPNVRYLALRDLLDRPEADAELEEARRSAYQSAPITQILSNMEEPGFWLKPGPGYTQKYRGTTWCLLTLAQLGASINGDERIKKAAGYVLEHTLSEGGKFAYNGVPSGTIDCLQGNMCWALNELGSEDPRLESAFDWMARSVSGDGIAPLGDTQAAERYFAYKCGPVFACGANGKKPCAWGATKVMLALSTVKKEKRTDAIEKAIRVGIDFFLSIDPADASYPTRTGSKPSRDWWKFGFPVFYITDLLQVVEAMVRLGQQNDPRLKRSLELIRNKQDARGRWNLEFDYPDKTWANFGVKYEANKWVTLRALRVLKLAAG